MRGTMDHDEAYPDWYLDEFDDPDADPDVQRFIEAIGADHQ